MILRFNFVVSHIYVSVIYLFCSSSFMAKSISIGNDVIKFRIWDTSGQELV